MEEFKTPEKKSKRLEMPSTPYQDKKAFPLNQEIKARKVINFDDLEQYRPRKSNNESTQN